MGSSQSAARRVKKMPPGRPDRNSGAAADVGHMVGVSLPMDKEAAVFQASHAASAQTTSPGHAMAITPTAQQGRATATGVSAGFLLAFAARHPESLVWTTAQVVERIIRPTTAVKQCRYVDSLEAAERSTAVQTAQVFVSHSWSASFGLLVAAATDHVAPDCSLWIDIFAVSQWPCTRTQDDLRFDLAVHSCRALLLVCPEIHDLRTITRRTTHLPAQVCTEVPFLRIWCLFEIASAVAKGIAIVMKVGHVDLKGGQGIRFLPSESGSGVNWHSNIFLRLIEIVDVEVRSFAQFEEDRTRILSLIAAMPGGFSQTNTAIKGALTGAQYVHMFPEIAQAAIHADLTHLDVFAPKGTRSVDRDRFFVAVCAFGAPAMVAHCLKALSMCPDAADGNGWTALMAAAQGGHIAVLDLLAEAGADPLIIDKTGWSAMRFASQVGGEVSQQWMDAYLHRWRECHRPGLA
eukprot:m.259901 g.259901  ORF g.259901 m.259901 type:complete len:462 (+) comp23040_c0_seq1:120-1505(+)